MRGSLSQSRLSTEMWPWGTEMDSQGWAAIFNGALNADRVGTLYVSAERQHFRKTKLSHKIKETMKAKSFIDKVRAGNDIKFKGVKRNYEGLPSLSTTA